MTKIYSGKFKVTHIRLDEDPISIDVTRSSDGLSLRHVDLLAKTMSRDDYQWFKDSVSGLEVEMTLVSTVKNGKVIASYLQSFSLPGVA